MNLEQKGSEINEREIKTTYDIDLRKIVQKELFDFVGASLIDFYCWSWR